MTSRTGRLLVRILIIDADEKARADLARFLETRGFYVSGYHDVASASEMIDDNMPDVIFADLPPPEIEGLADRLEESESLTPIVACSVTQSSKDVVDTLRAGASDFVLKPFGKDKKAIADVIRKLLDRVRVGRLNQLYRQELEDANRDLRDGIAELRADQRAGRKVQLRMLPEKERFTGGLYVDHLIKPSLYLSGDFLDYFPLTEDKTLVYIADVSGHGASSAFVTVLLKNLSNRLQRNLRRGSTDDILYPDRFLERVNSELLDTGLGKHVTIFVGVISLSERTLKYAVGAHFPMPVLSFEGGETAFLEGNGLPVGLFESPEWEVYEVALEKPFHLILFSDGILEVIRQKSLDEKEQRLLELVSGGRHTVASLSEALNLDEITELPDDIGIVTVTDTMTVSENTSLK
ncbi:MULTISPECIES: PP2C family protein-serine/threonine phosphatase [unclassified Marinobacter]|uniref:PP2C family protein-serine/threonine phosphatase n=1 Tax=unclassified Marinobacter TaxID=83889 RepID=UPI0026E410F2|nr:MULTISPECIES: SpoIIE family protein phosphatase [unclassified Marinobacter]MDO6442390.1 SpoIIE family protein phosphatase [Marinobacter sp. 2_MG-2023]MDO6824446.1 SpoIIE family protein phosphatase [Marinobacter sp. 1_MG-2023]